MPSILQMVLISVVVNGCVPAMRLLMVLGDIPAALATSFCETSHSAKRTRNL